MTFLTPIDVGRYITLRYAAAIALVAALATGAWVTMVELEKEHAVVAKVVNVSGRQRMLSQRIALIVDWRAQTPPGDLAATLDQELAEALRQFEDAHAGLSRGNRAFDMTPGFSAEAQALYFDPVNPLDAQVAAFIAAARASGTDAAAAEYVRREAAGPLLARLDQAVLAFETAGLQRVAFMERVHTAVWLSTLLILLLEVLFIFRPLARRVAANARAEQAEMARRRRLFGQIAHDLRTPINIISGYADALRDEAFGPMANEEQRRSVDGIAAATGYQLSMANDLALLARMNSADDAMVANDPVDMRALIRECATMMEVEALQAKVTLEVVDSGPRLVVGDAQLLRRVLLNLLTNALRYGGGFVRVAAAVAEQGEFSIIVADGRTTPSVTEFGEEIEDFETTPVAGVGVGLLVCQDVMAAHQGALRLARNTAQGVSAVLRFPAARVLPA